MLTTLHMYRKFTPKISVNAMVWTLWALHSAPAASALQLLKSGTISFQLFETCLDIFVAISRPIISSRSPNLPSAFLLSPPIRILQTIVCVHKLYLLTYVCPLLMVEGTVLTVYTTVESGNRYSVNELAQHQQRTAVMPTPSWCHCCYVAGRVGPDHHLLLLLRPQVRWRKLYMMDYINVRPKADV